jgi:O-antigen/teichoic acid export membrane protein
MTQSIRSEALSGAKWNTIAQFGQYLISFGLSIILARILLPSEFGLIGMLSIFFAVAMVFINSGLSTAIIRTSDVTIQDFSTVFYFNMVVSLFFYVLLFISAPIIANFYNEPQLIKLVRITSLVFVINAFGITQNAILIKKLDFKKQTICNLIGLSLSALAGSIMAFSGFGVYSIVSQILVQALSTNILLWWTSTWRPIGTFNIVSFKKLWAFGSKILATSILAQILDNVDNILIGKLFSSTQLGFYTRAKSTKQIPESIGSGILGATAFAVLSKVNNNVEELRNIHLKFLKLGLYIFTPIIFGLIVIAEPFIIVLYTSKWLPSVSLLRVLAITSIFYFIGVLFSQTIMAKGDANLYLKLQTFKKIVGLTSIPAGIYWGLLPFIYMLIFTSFLGLMLDFYYTGKLIFVRFGTYLYILIKNISLSLVMALPIYMITFLNNFSSLALLFMQISGGIFLYISISELVKFEEYLYLKKIVLEKINFFLKSN